MKNIFKIVFQDRGVFDGGITYQDTKWLNIPKDKKISNLSYLCPSGDYIVLFDYDKYFHMVECLCDLNGKNAGITKIIATYIIAKKGNMNKVYRFDFINNKIDKKDLSDEDEFIKKLNKDNWRG